MFEIQALGDAAQLGVRLRAAQQLQRNLLAAVADGKVDLAEAAMAERRASE